MILQDSLHNFMMYFTLIKDCQFSHSIFKINLIDDNAENEMSNYSLTFLQLSEMSFVRLIEDEYNAYSHKYHRDELQIMRRKK